MKYLRYVLTILLTLVILCMGMQISAIDTGFATKEMPQNQKENFLNNVAITLITEEPQKRPVKCFSVNEGGLIALGSDNRSYDDCKVCVYTDKGVFLYGYEFNCLGSFYLEFSGDTVIIYFVRSDVVVAVDSAGKIAGVEEILDTTENIYYMNDLDDSVLNVGDTRYRIKNDIGILGIFAGSYSQVVVTEAGGEERIIYDVSDAQFVKAILIMLFVLVFAGIAVCGLLIILPKTIREAQKPEVREKYDIENIIEILENKFKHK